MGGGRRKGGLNTSHAAMSLVKTLAKRGKFNKWFDKQAAHKTNDLYAKQFGAGVTRKCVQALSIRHVHWVMTDTGETAGAMMLSRQGLEPLFRVQGLVVSREFQRQGYGSMLLSSIDEFVGKGSTVWLCVDNGKANTVWLVNWYIRMGFTFAYHDSRLSFQSDEIPLKKLIQ
jgi:ribosomal protein S18 acetylase RimI-like enzyme